MADKYNEFENERGDSPESAPARERDDQTPPEELPPVEPPSAGFIVQLFLVPALIVCFVVMVVAGIPWLFGRLTSGEQDWQSLVAELRDDNPHRRWRGANGLAQMLRADARRGEDGQQLTENPRIAEELAGLLEKQLGRAKQTEDDLKHQAFLARTLGFLDVPDTVIPVLREAMQPKQDLEVRKNALAAVALIAGRYADRDEPLERPELTEDLVEVSADDEPLVRQMSAYALGLMPQKSAKQRLRVLLANSDANTRVNAAIGLARQGTTEGVSVFKKILADGARPDENAAAPPRTASADEQRQAASRRFERLLALKNAIKAVGKLSGEFSAKQRQEFIGLLGPLAENHREARIRSDARSALIALRKQQQ